MSNGEGSRTDDGNSAGPVNADQEALLDEALQQADQRLVASLQEDELRRRRRRRWAIGGFAMTITVVGIIVGLIFTGTDGKPADAAKGAATQPEKQTIITAEDLARADSLASRGWSLWGSKEYALAEVKFEDAIKLDPNSTKAWNGLGWSRFWLGDRSGAEKAFKKCVGLDENAAGALNGLGQIYFLQREYDKAEKYLLKAAADPQASAAWYGLARLYLLQEKYEQAAKWAAKVVDCPDADEVAKKMLDAARAEKLDPQLRRLIEPQGAPSTMPQKSKVDLAAWERKIKNLKTHKQTAFAVGPQLVALDPDIGFLIFKNTWPELNNSDVKTGLLKAFAFARHPRVLDVLHIGASEKDIKVRNYAYNYLENYAFQNFAEDISAYHKWHKEFG
ncbi:MAG: tetratricopeptide repeat protein, partial [Planctomycetota bacterium]